MRIVNSANSEMLKPVILSNNQNYQNIIYRGIDNLLKIEVPDAKSFIVTAPGLGKITKDSTYIINVNNIKEDKVNLDFTVYNWDGSVKAIRELLYIKNLTPKKITIGNKSCKNCILKLKLSELKNAVLEIKVDDAEESWSNMKVWSFIVNMPNESILEIEGDKINDDLLNKLAKLSKNSIVEITIPYHGSESIFKDPLPLKFMIIK